jgi:S-adenosylmethionine hydrolase
VRVAAAAPRGVVTLTTDFGLQDPFVGVMKGVILARLPGAAIVDLTHQVLAYWPAEAGFWLARSWRWFPAGTVHVAVVDPGVGTARRILAARLGGHVFLAPDNGLLAPLLDGATGAEVRAVETSQLGAWGIAIASATFHGRDIFAPLAAEIAAGRCDPGSLGRLVKDWVPGWTDPPTHDGGVIRGRVITVDHFGNLITDIDGGLLAGMVEPHVYAGAQVLPVRRTYGDVAPGSVIALVNSFGVVEVAVAEGRAEQALGLSRGAPISVRDAVGRR